MKRCKNDGEKMQKRYLTEHILRKKTAPLISGVDFLCKPRKCHNATFIITVAPAMGPPSSCYTTLLFVQASFSRFNGVVNYP